MTGAGGGDLRTVVALLRAVNVGSRQLKMAELRRVCEAAGWTGVRTYLQSGNVVLAAASDPDAVRSDLEARLAAHCGFDVPVIVRTAAELADVVARCPYPTGGDPTRLAVGFAPAPIGADDLGDLDADGFGDERFAAVGSELYLWLPDGQGRSPLAQRLTRLPAGRSMTFRNWRTVVTLAEWCATPG